jgi:hypothetical protein
MTREEAIEYLSTSCKTSDDLNGPHAYFIVPVSRADIAVYGTEEQLSEFDKLSVDARRKQLNDIADELHVMYEEDNFSHDLETVLVTKY